MQLRFGDTARLFAAVAIFLTIGNQAFTDTKAKPVPLDWQPLSLKHGWQSSGGAGYRDPAVAIDSNNIVHLRGAVHQAAGMDNRIFILPNAYRPGASIVIAALVEAAGPAYLLLEPDGQVAVLAANAAAAQSFTSLESITFPKDGTSPL